MGQDDTVMSDNPGFGTLAAAAALRRPSAPMSVSPSDLIKPAPVAPSAFNAASGPSDDRRGPGVSDAPVLASLDLDLNLDGHFRGSELVLTAAGLSWRAEAGDPWQTWPLRYSEVAIDNTP